MSLVGLLGRFQQLSLVVKTTGDRACLPLLMDTEDIFLGWYLILFCVVFVLFNFVFMTAILRYLYLTISSTPLAFRGKYVLLVFNCYSYYKKTCDHFITYDALLQIKGPTQTHRC